ncbi:site-specific integrase [Marinobacter fonticola]|uniref:site-specific integrase n=1 Tax=Marinobacter fonticola TaxID=2603215 RepID=UPI0011E7E46D|nr:site-specific integrase [Marinobacter fonticola]
MSMTEALDQSQSGLLSRVHRAIQLHKLNQRTEQTYLHWISRYVVFHDLKNPAELGDQEQQLFLGYLQQRMRVSRARLNQAKQALAFFYEEVLGQAPPTATAG